MKLTSLHQHRTISRYSSAMNDSLSDIRLDFLNGTRLGDVDIFIESNATVRKVRRIMEKRICQRYWSRHDASHGNGDRQRMRRRLTNHMIDIYGGVPDGFHYSA